MDIQEIKTFLERVCRKQRKNIKDVVVFDFPIKATDDKHLIRKSICIFSQFRDPIDEFDGVYVEDECFWLKYYTDERLAKFYIDSIRDEGIITRIQVLGDNGFNMTSRWNVCAKNGFSYYSFGVSQKIDSDLFPPTIAIQKFYLNELGEGIPKTPPEDVVIVVIEVANPFVAYAKLEESYQHVLLTNKTNGFKDVEILVAANGGGETETLMAHKGILAGRSSVFRAMLNSPMIEGQTSQIKLPDTEPGVFKEMLKYLYTGDADFKTYAADLFVYADKYNVTELMDLSEKYMAENIEVVGWMTVFRLFETDAYKNGLKVLRDAVKKYYQKNVIMLKESGEFESAANLYPTVFFDLHFS